MREQEVTLEINLYLNVRFVLNCGENQCNHVGEKKTITKFFILVIVSVSFGQP